MDIPTSGNELVDEAKKLAEIVKESEMAQVILGDVVEKASTMLDGVRDKAEEFGLGGIVDAAVNKAEDLSGIDIDQDGDKGI